MEFYKDEDQDTKMQSPLEAVHMIQDELHIIRHFINALDTIGLPVALDLRDCVDNINRLSKDCAAGISRESHERYKDTQQVTANMLHAVFAITDLKNGEKKNAI